ncbi:MAG: hypothetical protein ACYS76_06625 [Planctomycetota bacterium]|jgi:hypothetical protein
MSEFLIGIIAAGQARNDDGVGWMQILIFVVVAVVYALLNILRSRSSKLEQEERERLTRKPPRKPPRPRRPQPRVPAVREPVPEYRPQRKPVRRTVARPEVLVGRGAARKVRAVALPTLEPLEMEAEKLAPAVPLEEPRELISPTMQKVEERHPAGPGEMLEPDYLSEIIMDYADPDELRRAILHYEILGRPLSLREPREQSLGF